MAQGNSMRIQSLELHSMSLKVHVEEMEEKYKNITACHQAQIWTTQNVKKLYDYSNINLKLVVKAKICKKLVAMHLGMFYLNNCLIRVFNHIKTRAIINHREKKVLMAYSLYKRLVRDKQETREKCLIQLRERLQSRLRKVY